MAIFEDVEPHVSQLMAQLRDDGSAASEPELRHVARLLWARGEREPVSWILDVPMQRLATILDHGVGWTELAALAPTGTPPSNPEIRVALACLHVGGGECSPRRVKRLIGETTDLATLQHRLAQDGWIRVHRGPDPRGGTTLRWLLPLAKAHIAARTAEHVGITSPLARRAPSETRLAASALRETFLQLSDGGELATADLVAVLNSALACGDAQLLRSLLRRHFCSTPGNDARQRAISAAIGCLSWSLGDSTPATGGPGHPGELDHTFELLPRAASILLNRADHPQLLEAVTSLAASTQDPSELALVAWLAAVLAAEALAEDRLVEAGGLCETATWIAHMLEDPSLVTRCHVVAATISHRRGDQQTARLQLATVTAALADSGIRVVATAMAESWLPPASARTEQKGRWQALIAGLLSQTAITLTAWEWALLPHPDNLDSEEVARLWEVGRSCDEHRFLASDPRIAQPQDEANIENLTPRETEVSVLVSQGLTNEQIARRLGLSRWTVVNHLRNVMRKLNCLTRVQVATQICSWGVSQ